VTDVWVGGRQRVAGGVLLDLDESALAARATHWKNKLHPS